MRKFPFLFLFFVLFSCSENDIVHWDPGDGEEQVIARDASGLGYPGLDPYKIYCGPGWGRKFCRFTDKYDGEVWADGSARIKFSNFGNSVFVSFVNLDGIAPLGDEGGWGIGETTYNGIKWNIEFTRDEVDVLWFDYDYYGSGEEIEYSIAYKCEVVDGVLNFSSSDGLTLIFHPF